ncbi:hypothetical protein ACJMK2_035446 [Sinanodonta woodiana]|uniref:Uncharacterized protein n=1 Tax=Sinanodonta woodiana TaxID=1069815 RepID=A0ABD3WWS1_SINWO
MATASDRTPILQASKPGGDVLYHDSTQTPRARLLQVCFVVLVVLMVAITLSLSIYRGINLGEYGGLYFMLGVSLMGYVVTTIILVLFVRKGELPREKTWFLYFVGGCVILEAIFTDVLLFQ